MATLDEDIFAEIMAADEPRKAAQEFHTLIDEALHQALEPVRRTAAQFKFDLFAKDPSYDVRPYILPFGKEYPMWNVLDVENHPFGKSWLEGTAALVCYREDEKRSRPSRIIFTSVGMDDERGIPNEVSERDKIGQRFEARHDQTNGRLGRYKIVGVVLYGKDGDVFQTEGDVADQFKLRMATYK